VRGIARAIEPHHPGLQPAARAAGTVPLVLIIHHPTQGEPAMAIYRITQANSVVTTGAFQQAFTADTPDADQLIVDADAFLATTGTGARAAVLNNQKAWKATVNGSVVSDQSDGLYLQFNNPGVSSVTVGAEGSVSGGESGVYLASSAVVTNAGVIAGGLRAIGIADAGTRTITNSGLISGPKSIEDLGNVSNDTVINSGTISGAMWLNGGTDVLTNSGWMEGGVFMGEGNDKVTNSGRIYANVDLGPGTNTLSNTGIIDGIVYGGGGKDQVTNTKLIVGSVRLEDGTNKLTNSGVIGGSVNSGSGADTIDNSGSISGMVNMGGGVNTLTNSGAITGVVFGGAGKDTVTNTGTIRGYVSLGDGDDLYTGGSGEDIVQDGGGSDVTNLGSGNNTYVAVRQNGVDGTDVVSASSDIDTYDASAANSKVMINLDKAAHDFAPFVPAANRVAANTATGADVAGNFKDTITGFNNAIGGGGNDIIYGNYGGNILEGSAGSDTLCGYAGNDRLDGGSGADQLFGGAGKDILTGGTGADSFLFASTSDSGVTRSTRDMITDFQQGIDVISLAVIDANTTNGSGDNSFNFIGTNKAFTGAAGQLRAFWSADGLVIEGDVNGDRKADFAIELVDPNHNIALTSSDFFL
jgi:Ca2+-binding RTX toxin-like protein